MKWLRERPEKAEELDQVDWKGRWKNEGGVYGAGNGNGKGGDEDEEMEGNREVKKGKLFDDEDEPEDDDEEEEEEELGKVVPEASTATFPTHR